MDETQIAERINIIADKLDMHSFLDRRSETYSTGMKQKTSIARAVVHGPDVVVLDEPTTGLDIMAAKTVIDFIRDLKKQSVPVIFSTHHLEEVTELCDNVTVIDHGETTFDGTLEAFKALSGEGLHASFMASLKQGVA
jgi:sodium transport system ATP-binding protein